MAKQDIHGILKKLAKSYQQKHGVAVFSIDVKKSGNGYDLKGYVLTENQKDDMFNLIADNEVKVSQEDIVVLSDEKQRNEIGWGFVKAKTADLKSRFVSNKILNDKILRRIRCSQAFKNEIVRILFKNEDQFLVQQGDLTLGWIDAENIVMGKADLMKKWRKGFFAVQDEAVKSRISKEKIVEEAKRFIGTEYVLGGRSEDGIDCSGFVQFVYKNIAGLILPKHSWDQKKTGLKIRLKDAISGDLVFLIKKKNRHKHVGIIDRNGDKVCLIHASLDKKRVIRQNMNEVLRNYEFIEAKRLIR